MIRKRRTQIIAAIVALLVLIGAVVIGLTVHDEDVVGHVHPAAPAPPHWVGGQDATGAQAERHRDYGLGYESRQGRARSAPDATDPSNPPKENQP